MSAKIPATIVTGFLGAGKTTLIRHMLTHAEGRRIALVINEFGDLGVDGEILKGCGAQSCGEEDIVELSNGCICCTVAEDFVPTLQTLLAREPRPDHIVIETSGLALPQPLVRAFGWPEIAGQVTVDGVIAVVDGRAAADGQFAHDLAAIEAQRRADDTLDHETPLSELFDDQLACADMIVVNKSDLLEEADAARLETRLSDGSRDGVQIVRSSFGSLPVDVLLGRGAAAESDMARRGELHHTHDDHDDDHDHDDLHAHGHSHGHDHTHDHGHDAFESFVVTRGEIGDPAAFVAQVGETIRKAGILRLKGFAAVTGKPMRMTIQAVGPRTDSYYDRPFAPGSTRETRLVVIGPSGMDRAAIEAALTA